MVFVEIALAFHKSVFISEAVAVLIGVAVSGGVVRNDLGARLRSLRRRADEIPQQGHIHSESERRECQCLAYKACVHKSSSFRRLTQLLVRGPMRASHFLHHCTVQYKL